jgi:hypothetical protein
MTQPIGYYVLTDEYERPGELYNYIWAGNGVFIKSRNPLLAAQIPVAVGVTRGLPNITPEVIMAHGKIDQCFFDYILEYMLLTPELETYFAITWEDGFGYKFIKPEQQQTGDSITYDVLPNVVMELHSHPGNLGIGFSSQDDADETAFKIYGVVGCLGRQVPLAQLRVGVYGNFHIIDPSEVFQTVPTRVNFEMQPYNEDRIIAEQLRDYWKHLGREDQIIAEQLRDYWKHLGREDQ